MKQPFSKLNWKGYLPQPVCEAFPQYTKLYEKAWELACSHVKSIDGMPQSPYMDEGFCDTQIWIWDTCFMALFCKYAQEVFPGKESFENFYQVLWNGKELPAVIPTENEPEWTGAKTGKPYHICLHIADNPPLFAWAEYENALFHGDKKYLENLLYEKQSLQRHYNWLENLKESVKLPNVFSKTYWIATGLGYKWEGGRSGMDNTPRGRMRTPTVEERPMNPDMLWVDAICQQALSAKAIFSLFEILGDKKNALEWKEKYKKKKCVINENYWDETDGFYYDIDCNDRHFYKVPTIASYWVLTAKAANKKRAKKMLKHLESEKEFGGIVPFVSLSRSDPDYVPEGKYWRGGIWLPCAYATLKGLAEYGFYQETHYLALQLLSHMQKTYEEYSPHTIWECYSPSGCQPSTKVDNLGRVRPDFCGWSALGPISIYIEFVLGFHKIDSFNNVVEWQKPREITGEIGIKNLKFRSVVTDIVANGNVCKVRANKNYSLIINKKKYKVKEGETTIDLSI